MSILFRIIIWVPPSFSFFANKVESEASDCGRYLQDMSLPVFCNLCHAFSLNVSLIIQDHVVSGQWFCNRRSLLRRYPLIVSANLIIYLPFIAIHVVQPITVFGASFPAQPTP